VSLLTDLDAFFTEHRACGDLDGGVTEDSARVWMACSCGARIERACGWMKLASAPSAPLSASSSSNLARPTLGMPAFVPADERSGGRHQARGDEDGRRD
jgi:hypothetical protein